MFPLPIFLDSTKGGGRRFHSGSSVTHWGGSPWSWSVNANPILWNTLIPPGEYQVVAEQDHLKAAAAFRSCHSGTLKPSHKGYAWRVGVSLCLSHKLSSDPQQKSSPEFSLYSTFGAITLGVYFSKSTHWFTLNSDIFFFIARRIRFFKKFQTNKNLSVVTES